MSPDRRTYLRRRLVALGGVLIVLAAVAFGAGYTSQVATAAAPAAVVSLPAVGVDQPPAAEVAWPPFRAAALGAVGFDGVLASTGEEGSVPIASITKAITALVVLDAKPIPAGTDGPVLEFIGDDVAIYQQVRANGGSWVAVTTGQRTTLRDALAAMLIESANNYAISITNWAYGSQDAFLTAAHTWLQSQGLRGTRVTGPSGLDSGNVSTTADLIEVAKLVASDEVLAPIVASSQWILPGVEMLNNTNQVLGLAGIDGIKTGFTFAADHCLLFSASVGVGSHSVHVVGVALGADSYDALWQWVPALVASARSGFHDVTLVTKGDPVGAVSTEWGATSTVVAASTVNTLVYSNPDVDARAVTHSAAVDDEGVAAGTSVGRLDFTVGDRTLSTDLVVRSRLEPPDFWWRLTNPEKLGNPEKLTNPEKLGVG